MKFTCYAVHQNNNKLDTNFESLRQKNNINEEKQKKTNLINEIKSHNGHEHTTLNIPREMHIYRNVNVSMQPKQPKQKKRKKTTQKSKERTTTTTK